MNDQFVRPTFLIRLAFASCFILNAVFGASAAEPPVSYQKQVLPILQANCHGCHQPARANGKYAMTDFAKLVGIGESGLPAIVPGKPAESHLLKLITTENGKAEMPKDRPPLAAGDVERIKTWIAEGAVDDTPAGSKQSYDMDHPPIYSRQPVITSLDFSPDGQVLALAAFHEVLLIKADGSQLIARLVGVSERIESVKFSPDGKLLAVAGGLPARLGEVQVWDVASRSLKMSVSVTFDTVYGGKWSPDGRLIAFGCSDNSVRVIEAATGTQVLFQGAHTDWVRDTDFSVDGTHVVSVSRDMTAKLTEVSTQRFIDNITSITPGALKGGMQAVAMLPNRDEVLVGGSDGVPKVYRIYRKTARKISDDDNLMRSLAAMPGRVFGVAVSRDGFRMAAASALDGKGQVLISRFDPAGVPDNIKAMLAKPFASRVDAEKDAIENYFKTAAIAEVKTEIAANAYSVAFQPDGSHVAAACSDGIVRVIDATSGAIVREFSPAPIAAGLTSVASAWKFATEKSEPESLPSGAKVTGIEVVPALVRLTTPFDYAQLLVTARLDSGDRVDATRIAKTQPADASVAISASGVVTATADGTSAIIVTLGDQTVSVPVEVTGGTAEFHPDFIRDVNPILSRVGCNAGTCHGSVKGKNGFKLSLRGYDPIYDVRALTDDLSSRRVNLASPDDSLMLLKATSVVPHMGGAVVNRGEPYYEVIRRWVADGVKLDLNSAKVTKIEVLPQNPVVQLIGARQQLRVLATYADGRVRDVTREAFVESGNTEVATAERGGLLKSLRRGEAPMLVRYEGSYAATTLTVMGDRTGFVWAEPPANNRIDQLAAAKWQRMKIQPSALASDTDFFRRIYIDLIGLPPQADDVKAFIADTRDTKIKRDELIDRLIGSDDYVEYWSNKWADLLQVNGKFLAREGATSFRKWIRDEIAANTPYDQFAKKVITATGSNREVPQAAYYKILREATATMENTTHLFLAIRFNCNKCHDHPFERWTQDQYYETAAYFAQYGLDRDPASGDRNIGGTAVEGAKPLFESVVDRGTGEVLHERTSKPTPPKFPYALTSLTTSPAVAPPAPQPRRLEFADWLTSKDNPYFAKSYVNRLWGYLFGVGVIEPIDDIRAGNPATNPELLDYLTQEFLNSNFDVRHVMRLICKSRTYQLSADSNPFNVDDKINYSHAQPRRLPAEVLFDSVHRVTGTITKIPGVAPGSRAAALPDSGIELPSGFFATFGRPVRESACECERSGGLQLGPVMALISGATVSEAIADPTNELTKLVASQPDNNRLVDELSLRVLNRPAAESDFKSYAEALSELDGDHQKLLAQLKKREEDAAAQMPELEKKRADSIARTKDELANYEKEIAPHLAEMEKKRQDNIAARNADIKAYDDRLPAKVTEWEKSKTSNVEWIPLLPSSVTGSAETTLTIESDRSVTVEPKQARNVALTSIMPTQLKNITAIRLEVIANEKFPNGGGPGRSGDGNFVLTEFEVFAAPVGKSAESKKVDLHKPLSDFAQEGYPIANAITGNPNDGGKGWAVSPSHGVTHWATFEAKQPVSIEGGTELKVILHHKFVQPDYLVGRFRISVAVDRTDVGLTLADEYKAIVDTPVAQRNPQQSAQLAKFVKLTDGEFRNLQTAVGVANLPLPPDPKLVELQGKLELVSQPLPPDGKLIQLQADVKNSEAQLGDKRLTAAQDLVWAFINTPAFLFNR